jgi:hypothetical protein
MVYFALNLRDLSFTAATQFRKVCRLTDEEVKGLFEKEDICCCCPEEVEFALRYVLSRFELKTKPNPYYERERFEPGTKLILARFHNLERMAVSEMTPNYFYSDEQIRKSRIGFELYEVPTAA